MFGIFKKNTEKARPRFKVDIADDRWLGVREWNEACERYSLVCLAANDKEAEEIMRKCIKYPKFYEEKDGKVTQV